MHIFYIYNTYIREKGKAPGAKREKGKAATPLFSPVSTRHPAARTHARTKRNDFLVLGGLPRGVLTPPNLRSQRDPS